MDERRLLTVMFCDLVGSTALSSELDPEELREVVRSYQEVGAAAVESVGGEVAQYLGDGLLAYFGWPIANEDDPLRAVRAALRILQGLVELNERVGASYGVRLQARIGIQTGPTVIEQGDAGVTREIQAFGATPNIAARIQSLAEPDTVYIGETTAALVDGMFDLEDRGSLEVRGVQHSVRLARVVAERQMTRRFSISESRGLTPMVAREVERARLRDYWKQAFEGRRVNVLLTGDAGIGKSRLVHFVESFARDSARLVIFGQCSALTTNTPLAPVASALRAAWSDTHDSLAEIADTMGERAAVDVPLLADLAAIPCDNRRDTLRGWTPQRVRRATMNAVAAYLRRRARVGPLLFIVEDLHWADASTLELLQVLTQDQRQGRTLHLFTARPDFRVAWRRLERMAVGPLPPAASEELVRKTARGLTLPAKVVSHVVGRTDGNPLFIEELTKTILQLNLLNEDSRGALQLTEGPRVPTTLYGSLMARIDALGPARRLTQIAALIGHDVDVALLKAACGLSNRLVDAQIKRLIRAELLSAPSEHSLLFRHALIRDAAADALVTSERRAIELRIAEALISRFPERASLEPERVAYHLTQAGEHRDAVEWWRRAALAAIQRSANIEAIGHLHSALAAVGDVADGPEKLATTLDLHTLLGVPLTLTRGWAHPDVGATYERASELCVVVGRSSQLPSRVGLTTYYLVRGQFQRARAMAEESREMAEALGDTEFLLEAEHDCGTSSFYLGEYDRALRHLERVEALYDASVHGRHAWMFGKDPLAVALVHRAMSMACKGSVDTGLAAARRAVSHAEACGHPFSYLWALIGVAITHIIRDEPIEAAEVAGVIAQQAEAQGFPNWLAQAQMYVGLGEAVGGEHEKGIDRIRQGLALWESTGAALGLPVLVCLLARALLLAGRLEDARDQVERAISTLRRTEECWAAPEAMRLRGDVELAINGPAAAGRFYVEARREASAAGARTFELAAATAHATTLLDCGGREEAMAFLQPALAAMPEGHESSHPRRGRALLDALLAAR